MMDEINEQFEKAENMMKEAIEHLQRELTKIRAGRATPAILNGILVDYYGNPTPINQVANITTPDSKMLSVQPWEKAMIGPIEQAIFAANLGLTPQNNGEMVVINIPPLTEERRKEMVKQSKGLGEDAKVSLRSVRQRAMDYIKKKVKDGLSEDMGKRKEEDVEKMIKDYVAKISNLIAAKEKDIMTI